MHLVAAPTPATASSASSTHAETVDSLGSAPPPSTPADYYQGANNNNNNGLFLPPPSHYYAAPHFLFPPGGVSAAGLPPLTPITPSVDPALGFKNGYIVPQTPNNMTMPQFFQVVQVLELSVLPGGPGTGTLSSSRWSRYWNSQFFQVVQILELSVLPGGPGTGTLSSSRWSRYWNSQFFQVVQVRTRILFNCSRSFSFPPPSPLPVFSATFALFQFPSLPLPVPYLPRSPRCMTLPLIPLLAFPYASLPFCVFPSRSLSRPLSFFIPRFPSPRFFFPYMKSLLKSLQFRHTFLSFRSVLYITLLTILLSFSPTVRRNSPLFPLSFHVSFSSPASLFFPAALPIFLPSLYCLSFFLVSLSPYCPGNSPLFPRLTLFHFPRLLTSLFPFFPPYFSPFSLLPFPSP